MTTCGYFWCWVIVILCIVSVTIAAVRGDKSGKTPSTAKAVPLPQSRQAAGGGKGEAEAGPRAYRRGGARYVSCTASTRLDEGYIVGLGGRSGDDPERMLSYAKKELAAVLAEQALAAGGIEFTVDGWELRAFMRTVTGEIGTPLPGAEEGGTVSPQPRRWRDEALKPGPGTANAARREEETPSTAEAVSEAGNVTRDSRVSILPQSPQAAGGGEG